MRAGTVPWMTSWLPRCAVSSGTARRVGSIASAGAYASSGSSSSNRCTGSHTDGAAAESSAVMSTSGARQRKSAAVLEMLLVKSAWPKLWRAQ